MVRREQNLMDNRVRQTDLITLRVLQLNVSQGNKEKQALIHGKHRTFPHLEYN